MIAPSSVVVASASTKTIALMIIVTPTSKRPSHYDARLEGGCVIVQASTGTPPKWVQEPVPT